MHINIYNSKGKLRKQVEVERIVPAQSVHPRFKPDSFAVLLADDTRVVFDEQYMDKFHPGWRELLQEA